MVVPRREGGKALGNTARDGIAVAKALNGLDGSHVIELIDVNMSELVTKERMLSALAVRSAHRALASP